MSKNQFIDKEDLFVVLTAFANDESRYLSQLTKEEEELHHILSDLAYLTHHNLSNTTAESLFDAFSQLAYKVGIFHYAGHANDTHLVLEDTKANAYGISKLIAECVGLPLVFLNGCSTQKQVEALFKAGVGLIIATNVNIDDFSAVLFSTRFYKSLTQGLTIERSFRDAKNLLITRDLKREADFQMHRYRSISWDDDQGSEPESPSAQFEWSLNIADENALHLTLPDLTPYINRRRLLVPFAQWLIQQHASITLTGLKGQTAIALDKIFVSLRGELSKAYEVFQTQHLYEEELSALEQSWQGSALTELEKQQQRSLLLGRTAIMPSIEERDMRQQMPGNKSSMLNLAEAFLTYDKLVVLGDPGTGKTTLARWLTLVFAKAITNGDREVIVPSNLVNASESNSVEDYHFGRVRLPILIRVGEFAQAKHTNPQLSMEDFLGFQSWMGNFPHYMEDIPYSDKTIQQEALHQLMMDFLHRGEALLILDGLDEISDDQERKVLVAEVQDFIHRVLDLPAEKGIPNRNKLLITSRIAGYHNSPVVHEGLFHVTIQPMDKRSIQNFCETWIHATHFQLNSHRKARQVSFEAMEMVNELLQAILDPSRQGVKELASNPLLLTELCKLYYTSGRSLPDTRTELYRKASDNFFRIWEERQFSRQQGQTSARYLKDKVFYILEDIAEYIHEKYPSGVIYAEEINILTEQSLNSFYQDNPHLSPQETLEREAYLFLKAIREEVGMLAARAEKLYGFLHLTFEEYFAARKLIRYESTISDAIITRAYQPRWREPLLMAIGTMNQRLLEADRNRVLRRLLEIEDPMGNLVPRSANLIALSFREMNYKPDSGLINDVVMSLIKAYVRTESYEDGGILRTNVLDTFVEMGKTQLVFPKVIEILEFVIRSSRFSNSFKNATAHIIYHLEWYQPKLITVIIEQIEHDHANWDWPFHRILRTLADHNPALLDHPSLELKQYLLEYPDAFTLIQKDQIWTKVCMVLYGGIIAHPEKSNAFALDPVGIIRDSYFTEDIIDGLDEEEQASILAPICLDALADPYLDHAARVDACLVLMVLEPEKFQEDYLVRLVYPDQELLRALVDRIDLLDSLIQPVLGYASKETIGALGEVVQVIPSGNLRTFVRKIFRISALFESKASTPINWIKDQPKNIQAEMLAEFWTSTMESDDPAYSMAVKLDCNGKEIEALGNSVIAMSFAYVPQVVNLPPYQLWAIERVPFLPKTPEEVVEEALRNISCLSKEFDMLKFWGVRAIKQLIEAFPAQLQIVKAILIGMDSQFYQTQLAAVFFPPKAEKDGEQASQPENPQTAEIEEIELESRFQVLFRHSHTGKIQHYVVNLDAMELAKNPGKGLREIFQLLTLLRHFPLTFWQDRSVVDPGGGNNQGANLLAQIAEGLIQQIPELGLKINGYLKLATFLQAEERADLIRGTLGLIAAISSIEVRAEYLRRVKPWLPDLDDLRIRYEALTADIPEGLLTGKRSEQFYPFLNQISSVSVEGTEFAALSVGALVYDFQLLLGLPNRVDLLWELMLQEENEVILKTYIDRIVETYIASGVQLSLNGALAISRLLRRNQVEWVYALFPVVKYPDAESVPVVAEWIEHNDIHIQAFGAVLLAEAKILNSQSFPHLERVLFQNDITNGDQFRNRANIALNQSYFFTSRVGLDCLKQIQRTLSKTPGYLNRGLGWLFECLIFDEAEVLRQLYVEAEGRGRKSKVAQKLLSKIHRMRGDEVMEVCLEGLSHPNASVQKSLLYSMVNILHKSFGQIRSSQFEDQLRVKLQDLLQSAELDLRLLMLEVIGEVKRGKEPYILLLKQIFEDESREPLEQAQAIRMLGCLAYKQEESYFSDRIKRKDEYHEYVVIALAEAICAGSIRSTKLVADTQLIALLHKLLAVIEEEELMLEALLAACQHRWYDDYTRTCIRLLGIFFQEMPQRYASFIPKAVELISDLPDAQQLYEESYLKSNAWMKKMVYVDALYAGGQHLPATFKRIVRNTPGAEAEFEKLVSRSQIFTNRMNGIGCLSLTKRLTPGIIQAIGAGLKDIVYVQEHTIYATRRFEEIDAYFVQELANMMDKEVVATQYAIIKALCAIGVFPKTDSAIRQEILSILSERLEQPAYQQAVFLIEDSAGGGHVGQLAYKGRLDHEIYRSILEVAGVSEKKAV